MMKPTVQFLDGNFVNVWKISHSRRIEEDIKEAYKLRISRKGKDLCIFQWLFVFME